MAPKEAPNRQRFELVPAGGDLEAEVGRLVSLGATLLGIGAGGIVLLADPDGNEFCVKNG